MTKPEKSGETPDLLRGTRYVRMLDGRTHRCRAPANRSDRLKAGRPKRGQGVPWLRAYLCAIAKRAGVGRHWWVELDLNRCFNAKGYSLSWGRELFRRLQADPFFRNLCKVRYAQKRLQRNGCFVILLAWRPYLRWDQEPLFYMRDRERTRHVRAALRDDDLELQSDGAARCLKNTGDCPAIGASHTNAFTSFSTAEQNNNGASAEAPLGGFAAAFGKRFAKTVPRDTKTGLRFSLNNGRNLKPKTSNLKLWKKAIQLSYRLEVLHWDNCKVSFSRKHAILFAFEGLAKAYTSLQITFAWQGALERTHATVTDGICRSPLALCLWTARRLLEESDPRPFEERFRAFYRQIKKN